MSDDLGATLSSPCQLKRDEDNAKKFKELGVSLSPESILFLDTFPGEEYKSKIILQNISANKMVIKVTKPYSLNFQVYDDGKPVFLSPGLSMIRLVTFKCPHEKVKDSHLPVWINNHCLEVPIRVKQGVAAMSVTPTRVNFGTIDLGAKCLSRYLLLTNTGAGSTKFSIDLGPNPLDITAFPKKGTLMPYSSVRVKLDLAAFVTGEHSTEFWVKGSPPTMIYVEVSVLTPFLQAVHPNTTARFTLIEFQPTYFLTVRYETLVVRNMSSAPASFVVLAEINEELMTLDDIREKCKEEAVNYNCFSVEPLQGCLGPFESRIFTVWFHPNAELPEKGWMQDQPQETEYLCFLRIFKIDVTDWPDKVKLKTSSTYKLTDEGEDNLDLRLCLHGRGQKPRIGVLTSSFIFNPVAEGEKLVRVIHLKNMNSLVIFCRFKKVPGFEVRPTEQILQGNKSVELTLYFKATSLGNANSLLAAILSSEQGMSTKYIIFDVLSYHDLTNEKGKSLIGQLKIPVQIKVQSTTRKPEPKFIMGITPADAHEVGFLTEDIKFSDNIAKPKAIAVPKYTKNKPWLISDDHIAFPNDMTKSFRVKETDKLMRSIYTGKKRYLAPMNRENTFTEFEVKTIKEHQGKYQRFVGEMSQAKLKSILAKDNTHCWSKTPSEMRLYKNMGMESLQEKQTSLKKPTIDYNLHDVYYPLTPIELYNVRIMPKNLDFGQIPPHVNCSRKVAVENMNEFPVSIFLHMQKDSSNMNDDKFVVGPRQKVEKHITLNLESLGKYYSNVSFVVNHNECLHMTLVADVVRRTLVIVPNEIVINSKSSPDDIFQVNWTSIKLVNNLYVPTSFEWKIPISSPFQVLPEKGTVPGQRDIRCAIYYGTTYEYHSVTCLDLTVINGEQAQLKIIRIQDTSHNVALLLQKKVLPPLSANLKFVETALLFNNGFRDAIFSVVNPNPIDGVTIFPIVGKVIGKSVFGINVDIQINSVVAFDFNLEVKVQYKSTLEVKYVGFVFFPKIKLTPKKLELANIPCYSLTTYGLKAENSGSSVSKIHFLYEGYPQITLSEFKKHTQPGFKEGESFILQPGASKDFYLHFMPCDFATYELLLPVVFNQSIGPPIIHNDDSQQPLSYVKPAARVNRILKNIDLTLPAKITSMRIDCSVGRGFLSFSQFKFNFKVPAKHCSQRKHLIIKNLTEEISHITFDLKGIFSNAFYFLNLPKDGSIDLDPLSEINLQIVFSPVYPDIYEVDIPVFVPEYSSITPYNIITLIGNLHKPTLNISEPYIHFLPVPVGVTIEKCFDIVASYQPRNTKITYGFKKIIGEYEESLIEISFPKGNRIPAHEDGDLGTVIPVSLKFRSKTNISQRGTLTFIDDCDGSCEVLYTACANNSVMSCYQYLTICRHIKNKEKAFLNNFKSGEESVNYSFRVGEMLDSDMHPDVLREVLEFPMFPSFSSETAYAEAMRSVLNSAEIWLYEQGFSGSYRMIVGEHIAFTRAFVAAQNARAKNTNQAYIKSIVDLLSNFIGRDLVLEYQLPKNIPEENIERIEYSLLIFKQVLKFLKVQGGNVSHVFPVYMLPFEDYLDHLNDLQKKSSEQKKRAMHYQDIFEERFSKLKILVQDDFERYNKQAWMDVILQLHRVIIQGGIPYLKEPQKYLTSLCPLTHSEVNCQELGVGSDTSPGTNYRSMDRGDKILINWLNVIYHQVKLRNPEFKLPPRTISDFGEDLEDAVVLSVATIFYCPYLIDEYFNDFYFKPVDSNQCNHNAIILCVVWSTIRLGITVTPQDFFDLSPVFMNMLVTHLYMVLQTYVPHCSIEFLACLTSSVTRKISLINPNEKAIGYAVKILGDSSKSFTIEKSRPVIVISPKTISPISITFSAKKLFPTKATLLLCGHCVANGYVENIVLTLQGDPYNLVVSRDYTVNTPLMKPTFIIANVLSPYSVEAEYDLWYTEEEPKRDHLKMKPWSEVKLAKVPRSLFLGCEKLTVPAYNASRPAPLSITAACFTRTILQFWIILRNDEVGDFIIRVVLKPKLEIPSLIIRVPLPTGICTGYQSSMLCSSRCPRLIQVNIPSRNTRLWTTVKTMLAMTLQSEEQSFWDTHYETRIGLDLMKWLMGKDVNTLAKEIKFIFDSKVNYKVTSLSPVLQVQEEVEIADIHSFQFSKLKVHLCCWVQSDFCADIMLESESEQEVRLYRIKFYGVTPLGDKIIACRKMCSEEKPSIYDPCEDPREHANEQEGSFLGSFRKRK